MPGLHRHHLGAEHLHAEHVGRLARHVDGAHVDHAFQAEAGAEGGGGDAVLAGAGLGDDARLAHAARQHDLAEHVVHLVRAGVVQLVALEEDLRALPRGGLRAQVLGHALGVVERARPADIVGQVAVHLGLEGRVGLRGRVGRLQVEDQRHQRLGHEASAEDAEAAALVRAVAERVRRGSDGHGHGPCRAAFVDRPRPARGAPTMRPTRRIANSGPFGAESKGLPGARPLPPQPRAAAMKAAIRAGDFSPGRVSTPEETSTARAPVRASAVATLSGVRPPESMQSAGQNGAAQEVPVEGVAVAAGQRRARGRLGVEEDAVGRARDRRSPRRGPPRRRRRAPSSPGDPSRRGWRRRARASRGRGAGSSPGRGPRRRPPPAASSGSTRSTTRSVRPFARAERARPVSRSTWRGLLGKCTKPTRSAPASRAASRVAAVLSPQILIAMADMG